MALPQVLPLAWTHERVEQEGDEIAEFMPVRSRLAVSRLLCLLTEAVSRRAKAPILRLREIRAGGVLGPDVGHRRYGWDQVTLRGEPKNSRHCRNVALAGRGGQFALRAVRLSVAQVFVDSRGGDVAYVLAMEVGGGADG